MMRSERSSCDSQGLLPANVAECNFFDRRRDTPRVVSQENVEIARRVAEAGARRDFEEMDTLVHPDSEFVSILDQFEGRVWRGVPGYREWIATMADTIEMDWSDDEASALDADHVLLAHRLIGRGKLAGVPYEQRAWSVMTIKHGLVTRAEVYPSRAEALKAACATG
jgi:ketosteroid isomerase-like protein